MDIFLFDVLLPHSMHGRPKYYMPLPASVRSYSSWAMLVSDTSRSDRARLESPYVSEILRFDQKQRLVEFIGSHDCLVEQYDPNAMSSTLAHILGLSPIEFSDETAVYLLLGQSIPNEFRNNLDFPLKEYLDITAIS